MLGVLHRLDAFGQHLDAERVADLDDRADELALGGRVDDRHDELTVDLEPLRLQLHQADDRGVAGAEIVDLDVDAESFHLSTFQAISRRHCSSRKIDSTSSKEMAAGLDLHLAQARDQFLVVEAARRHVDRRLAARAGPATPTRRTARRVASSIRRSIVAHDVEFLGDLQESGRAEQARFGCCQRASASTPMISSVWA